MIYVLIVLWTGYGSSISGKAALSVEFNSMQACQAAAVAIRRQSSESEKSVGVMVCAAKGEKK